ncbi:uncharacterized protein [Branchiostoma lanceolatum]|uniref:uncharacterized protein n=1 Tax=Branchiostoma lanceolatum TaxID=7740 RepID=UPI003455CB9B
MATGNTSGLLPAYSEKVWVEMKGSGVEPEQESLCPRQHVSVPQQYLPQQQYLPLQQYVVLLQPNRQAAVVTSDARPLMNDQEPTFVPPEQGDIRTYMGLSIFTALFCCLPVGALAIAKSCEVKDAKASRDSDRAKNASNVALCLNDLSAFLGIICWVLLIIRIVLVSKYQ